MHSQTIAGAELIPSAPQPAHLTERDWLPRLYHEVIDSARVRCRRPRAASLPAVTTGQYGANSGTIFSGGTAPSAGATH